MMIPADNHVVRRTSLEVTGSVGADAFRFQQEVVVWAHDSLLPELGRIFASLPNSDELIRVDRLDLELSASDGGNWGPEVLGNLRSELISALTNRTRSARPAGAALVAVDAMDEDVSVGRGFLDTLAYYLETGVLPWSFAVTSQSALDDAMQHWLTSSDVGRLRPHVAQLLQTGSVRSRFLASFSQDVLQKTLTVFFDVPEQIWEQVWLDSETLRLSQRREPTAGTNVSPDSESDRLQPRLAEFSSSRQGPRSIPALLLREFVDALAANSFIYSERTEFDAVKSFLARLVREERIGAGELRAIRFDSRSFQRARDVMLEAGSRSTVDSTPVPPASSTAGSSPALAAERSQTTASSSRVERRPREKPAVEGIFIQNAGLVLVAPFLPTLLERVGVASGGALKDPGMAMALMHYLACGEEGPAEFQVVLPKVLCGWEIETQIDLPGTIPAVMKDEGRLLLESAVAHWAILKDTSAAGLQEAFLSRAGKISQTRNDDWLLQVEQRPFDMLIQQLPWSFKLIKLSWMTRLLRTEWVD
jgi:hypothetical protein